MDLEAVLSTSEFFRGLSPANKTAVAGICVPRHVAKRQVLFTEGQRGTSLYVCINGSVQLSKAAPGGKDAVVRVIKAGEMFAEVILFESDRYPVTAAALTRGLVFVLEKKRFHALLDQRDFRNDFIAVLMRKQRYLAEKITYLSLHEVRSRLAFFLREHFGERETIVCPLSKKDVAAAIGATPETLSRELLRLREEQLVSWDGRSLRVSHGFWRANPA
jgi:CRP/FNR family transcriptional regulator